MSRKELQDLYDKCREAKVNDLKDELQAINDQIKQLEFDLVEQGKVEWQDMTEPQWRRDKSCEETFWVYKSDFETREGIWKGVQALEGNDLKHWEDFYEDYFYYGGPNFTDANAKGAEMSEREMAFEYGTTLEFYYK